MPVRRKGESVLAKKIRDHADVSLNGKGKEARSKPSSCNRDERRLQRGQGGPEDQKEKSIRCVDTMHQQKGRAPRE